MPTKSSFSTEFPETCLVESEDALGAEELLGDAQGGDLGLSGAASVDKIQFDYTQYVL